MPDRRPLAEQKLRQALADLQCTGPVRLLETCRSTNDVAREMVAAGAGADPEWVLVAADAQSAGRGRLDRSWESPFAAGLLFSLSLDAPADTDPALVGVLPLAAGVAIVEVCRLRGVAAAALKWPNDIVLAGTEVAGLPRKLGGILAERTDRRVIIGVGLNFDLTEAEAPTPQAAALREFGLQPSTSREELLASCTAAVVEVWRELRADGPEGALARYRALCVTLGQQVSVAVAGAATVAGEAVGIDPAGHLLVRTSDRGVVAVSAGDVRSLPTESDDSPIRPAEPH